MNSLFKANQRLLAGLGTGAVVAALALTPQPNVQAAPSAAPAAAAQAGASDDLDVSDRADALLKALRQARKGGLKPRGLNPFTSIAPPGAVRDYLGWQLAAAKLSQQRSSSPAHKRARVAGAPLAYAEKEAAGARGVNDTPASAEELIGFGTGANPKAEIKGVGSPEVIPASKYVRIPPTKKADDDPTQARDTGISAKRQAIKVRGGFNQKDASDWLRLDITKRSQISLDFKVTSGRMQPRILILDEHLNLAVKPEFDESKRIAIDAYLEQPGRYYVWLLGLLGERGTRAKYDLRIGASEPDVDVFKMTLNAGDVVGAAINRPGWVTMSGADGERHGSPFDVSFIYPAASPLPGAKGFPLTDFVAAKAGTYYLEVVSSEGAYRSSVEVYAYGGSTAPQKQTIFLDTDGARVNTRRYGRVGVVSLSPLSSFLKRWGLKASDEAALVAGIKANVEENLRQDLVAAGLSDRVDVDVVTSQDGVDLTDKPGVTTIVVGGTIRESGIETIGIAESIDPGNFAQTETGLVLLDLLSGPDTQANEFRAISLNRYLKPSSNRIGFIAQGVGNIASHEAGHMLGNWHQDPFNEIAAIMDSGGNFPVMFGVGPDKIGGTADDVDVDFALDVFSPFEGFRGQEDTVARTSWAVSR